MSYIKAIKNKNNENNTIYMINDQLSFFSLWHIRVINVK